MPVKRILTAALIFISLIFLITTSASARDWDDLYEEDDKVFGSEKELKYNPDMFFLQRETWDNHYSFMLFWLFKYTDYPKYNSVRLFPLYHTLDSKIDNRTYSFIPVTLTYWETDGNEKYRINPLFISGALVIIKDMRITTVYPGCTDIFIQNARHRKSPSVYGGHQSSR
jgi:hypothetical protein